MFDLIYQMIFYFFAVGVVLGGLVVGLVLFLIWLF
jgi:hypothetical protein